MRKASLGCALALALASVLAMAPSAATAQEAPNWANKSGAVGIGANTTLGGTNGINIRTWVSGLFGIQGTLGFDMDSQTRDLMGGEQTSSNNVIAVGLYGTYKLAYWQRGSLAVLFGTDIARQSTSFDLGAGESEDSTTDILIGLGIQGEYFPTQYLSLFAQAGLRMDFLTDGDAAALGANPTTSEVSGIDISLSSDLWGSAGFTVWFK